MNKNELPCPNKESYILPEADMSLTDASGR